MMLIARQMATVVGRPSGTAATIRTMLVMKASETLLRFAVPSEMNMPSWIKKAKVAMETPQIAITLPR